MRGPGLRIKYDVRRLWRCPRCGYERHAPATEVAVRCHCSSDEAWMKLVEPLRVVRLPAPPLDLYVEFPDDPLEGPDDEKRNEQSQVTNDPSPMLSASDFPTEIEEASSTVLPPSGPTE